MEKETTADYGWAMDKIKELFNDRGIDHQLNFVTNRELALMTALSKTYRFYYVVGISAKNIFAKPRTAFPLQEYFDRFLEYWSRLVNATTEAAYEEVLEELRDYLPRQAMNYSSKNGLSTR